MSEIEADREVFAAAEAGFIRRRGTPLFPLPEKLPAPQGGGGARAPPLAAAAGGAFTRGGGPPFLFSRKAFDPQREGRAPGAPIEAIEEGIDDAFPRREERTAVGRVNSLSYCRDAVLLAWERRSEAMVGRGTGRAVEAPPTAMALGAFAQRLGEIASERRELAEALESARRSLSRLADSERDPVSVEESLVRLDKKLANAVYEALGE